MTLFSTLRIALVLAALLSIASPAQAYLDPGTGSMLLSAVIGVVAAVGLALKMFWYQLVGLVRGKRRGPGSRTAGESLANDE
jgi:hypothetical protein